MRLGLVALAALAVAASAGAATGPSTIHVASGTGVFTGAQGTTTETDYANADRALNVYRLSYGAVA